MLTNIIEPQKISLQTIKEEVAKVLHIAVAKIKRCEYWSHQMWVNIEGKRATLVSYRSLPAWLQQIVFAIRNCTNLEQLWELGLILNVEKQRFKPYYPEEYVQKLREIWADKRESLREEARSEIPPQQHRQDANDWLECWTKIIARCDTIASLEHAYFIMERQSKEFADLPAIFAQLLQIYQQRWEKLVEKEKCLKD